jgi:hypothetical protein
MIYAKNVTELTSRSNGNFMRSMYICLPCGPRNLCLVKRDRPQGYLAVEHLKCLYIVCNCSAICLVETVSVGFFAVISEWLVSEPPPEMLLLDPEKLMSTRHPHCVADEPADSGYQKMKTARWLIQVRQCKNRSDHPPLQVFNCLQQRQINSKRPSMTSLHDKR